MQSYPEHTPIHTQTNPTEIKSGARRRRKCLEVGHSYIHKMKKINKKILCMLIAEKAHLKKKLLSP